MYLDLLQKINNVLYKILGASSVIINMMNSRLFNNYHLYKFKNIFYTNEKE